MSTHQKSADEIYCYACGKIMNKEAVVCVHCGVQNLYLQLHQTQHSNNQSGYPKDKSVAVILAVFTGFFAWIYTYKKDAWKFWVNLGLSIVTFFLWSFIAWIWAIIDLAVRDSEYYRQYPNG